METLRQQLLRIQQQLGGLSASQKMLTASLVAIMVMTLLWWARIAAQPEMTPVLNQPLSTDELARITSHLTARAIPFTTQGDRVMVPTERVLQAQADLSYAQMMPADTRRGYDEIIRQMTPWDSQSRSEAIRTDAKAAYLAQVMRLWPNIKQADVFLSPMEQRRLGGGRKPSATVFLLTGGGQAPEPHLILAAADAVRGAVPGIEPGNVSVIVNGVSYPVPDARTDPMHNAGDILSRTQHAERVFAQKIADQLRFIQGVLVQVTVDLEVRSTSSRETIYDKDKVAQKESEIVSELEEMGSGAGAASEPGAVPNTGLALDVDAASGGGGGTRDRSETKFENKFSEAIVETTTPAGKPRVIAAAVRVPRSYFISVWQGAGGGADAQPSDEQLAALIAGEIPRIRNDVKFCTGIEDEGRISVEPYTDVLMAMTPTQEPKAAASVVSLALAGRAREITLGVLAVVSLLMVSMIARRSTPAPPTPREVERREPQRLAPAEEMAGIASGETTGPLDAMEIDDAAVRAQQMVDQVSTMVKENPDAAANLVRRWLNRP